MIKKTASKPRNPGGVNKDPNLRVKVKMLPPPVKKSKNEVAKVDTVKLSKLRVKGMRSIFGDSSEKILQLLETNDTDSAVTLIYKKTLGTLVDLLPYAEHAIRKSKGARGVYQINAIISSMREIMTDIQSAQDRGAMGTAVMDSVVRPAFSDIGMDIVKEYSVIGADAKLAMTEKEWSRFQPALRASRTRLANCITAHYRSIHEGTVNYLQK